MEASMDGKLVRQYHSDLIFRIPRREGVKRVGPGIDDDGRIIIKCPSVYVSKRHCEIFWKHRAFWVKDLNSSNGTYLNGLKINSEHERELRFGDTLGLGVTPEDTNTPLNVTDANCYLFKFLKEDKELEVIDLDEEDESPPVSNKKAVEGNKSDDVSKTAVHTDSDEDIQFVGEIPNSSPASSNSATTSSLSSTKKIMPPPPPPPIISKSNTVPIPISSTPAAVVNGYSLSVNSSKSSIHEKFQQFSGTPSDSCKAAVDAQAKRPSLQSDEEPPKKRSKPDQNAYSSSGDDSSDGLDDIVAEVAVNSRAGSKRNIVSSGEDSDSSSDEKSNKIPEAQSSWINIPTEKLETLVKTKKPKPLPAQSKRREIITKSNHVDNNHTPGGFGESSEDVERRKYDELRKEALRDFGRVRLQQIIQYEKGRYKLTNPTYGALKPSCRTRMQARFRESLQRNKDYLAQQDSSPRSVETNNHDNMMKNDRSSPCTTDTEEDENAAKSASERIYTREILHNGLDSPDEDFSNQLNQGDASSPAHVARNQEPETLQKSKMPQRGIQFIEDAPSPRFALKAQSKFSFYKQPAPQSTSKYQKVVQNHDDSPATSPKSGFVRMTNEEHKQARSQKLKEMELKKQKEKAETLDSATPRKVPQPAKIKLTSKNRNQCLMESIIDSKTKSSTEVEAVAGKSSINNAEPSDEQERTPRDITPISLGLLGDPRLIGNNNSWAIPRGDPRTIKGASTNVPGGTTGDPRPRANNPSSVGGNDQGLRKQDNNSNLNDPRLKRQGYNSNVNDPRLKRQDNNLNLNDPRLKRQDNNVNPNDPRLKRQDNNVNPNDPRLKRQDNNVNPNDPRLRRQNSNLNLGRANNPETHTSSNVQTLFSNNGHKVRPGPSKLKPFAEVTLSQHTEIGQVAYKEKQKAAPPDKFSKKVVLPPAVPEDDIYKRILSWRAAWLQEQKNIKDDPPLLRENESLTTTLIRYESYDAYFKIYYLLLLSEIWATISSDSGSRSTKDTDRDRSQNKRTEYRIKIDDVRRVPYCPLTKRTPHDKLPEDDWVVIKYHAWVRKTGDEIDHRKDFVQLTVKGKDTGGSPKSSNEKTMFGFPLIGSERYDLIVRSEDCDSKLREKGTNIKDGRRYTETIVCRYGSNFIIDKAELGHVTKLCSIAPKLREFRVLNSLQNYNLSRKIISPQEEPHKSWQTWLNKNATVKSYELISICRNLNLEQKEIIKCVSSRISSNDAELMLMHGPPGTGKTTTIVALVLQLLVMYQKKTPARNHRILICTPSNAAIDEIMRRLRDAIKKLPKSSDGKQIDMVRIGDGYADDVKDYFIDRIVDKLEEERSTAGSIKAEITSLENEIDELKLKIADLKKDKHCNPISMEARLGELKEKEVKVRTLTKDLKNVMVKSKLTKIEMNNQRVNVLKDTQIICTTLSSSGTSVMRTFVNGLSLDEKSFLCCIVDEASQTTELETLLPLVLNVNKMLLVGDPHQLGATVKSKSAEEKKYEQSLFSRHYQFHNRKKSSSPVMTLTCQYRMHKSIVNWPNIYFYEGRLMTYYKQSESKYPLRPYYFLNVSSGREHSEKEGQIENVDEVIMVKALVETIDEMLLPFNLRKSIGIITPYAAQKQKIRNVLEGINQTFKCIEKLDVDTVDGFQGQERDIIILSCVRTDATGFLKSKNRLNVALTRAKHSLYIIGDTQCLCKEDMWRCLIQDASKSNNTFNVNPNFRHDLKLLKTQLCNNLKKSL